MGAAAGGQGAGLGYVDGLPAQGRLLLDGLELPLLFVQQGGEFLPGLVNQLARLGALLGGELAHAPQKRRKFAFFPQHLHPQVLQGLGAVQGAHFLGDVRPDPGDLFLHIHGCPLLPLFRAAA